MKNILIRLAAVMKETWTAYIAQVRVNWDKEETYRQQWEDRQW